MSARRATSETIAPGAKLSATIARFCSSVHPRRRSRPLITSTRVIAPSLTPVQAPSLALMLVPSTSQRRCARRPSPEGYASSNKEVAAAGLRGVASELITSASKPRGFLATPSYLRLWFAGGIGNAMRWLERSGSLLRSSLGDSSCPILLKKSELDKSAKD